MRCATVTHHSLWIFGCSACARAHATHSPGYSRARKNVINFRKNVIKYFDYTLKICIKWVIKSFFSIILPHTRSITYAEPCSRWGIAGCVFFYTVSDAPFEYNRTLSYGAALLRSRSLHAFTWWNFSFGLLHCGFICIAIPWNWRKTVDCMCNVFECVRVLKKQNINPSESDVASKWERATDNRRARKKQQNPNGSSRSVAIKRPNSFLLHIKSLSSVATKTTTTLVSFLG